MADSFLPAVVIGLEWNDDSVLAGVARDKAALDELAAKSDETTAAMSGGMKGVADDSDKYLAGDVAGNLQHVGDTADDTADRVHDSAGRLSGDLENIGEGAIAGSSATKGAMEDAAKGVDDAEKDVEGKSRGFSGRISSVFDKVGGAMSNWGIPFGHTVSDMGSKIDEADTKGKGFSESLAQIGKVATVVGGVALAGVAAESLEMADKFDVAQTMLQNAIKDTGGSFAAVRPQIEATDSQMAHLGFNDAETAKSLQLLTISTKSPTTAMQDMGTAADLARAKNMSLEAATQTLTKVYAGSTRALTQLGLNLDVGTGKLKSIQSATESVKSAQLAYKAAQEEAALATGEKAVAADNKLAAAHLKLEQAQTKLRMDQSATGDILSAVKKRTEDAARAYGQTLAGQLKIAGAQVHNLGVSFGEFLMPAITAAVRAVADLTNYLLQHKAVALAVAAVIAGPLVAAIGVYIGAMIAANAATLGIGAVIGLLVIGIVELATHWQEAADFMRAKFDEMVEFVKSHITLLMVALAAILGPIGLLIDGVILLATKWKQITSEIATFTSNMVTAVVGFFESLPSKLWSTIKGIPSDIAELWHDIEHGVPVLLSNITHFFTSLPAKIVSAVAALPGDFLKLGEEIMHAVISGVEHLASAFVSTIKKTILGPIESVVGVVEGLFGGGGKKSGHLEDRAQPGGGSVEKEVLNFWLGKGFSANAAKGFVGNAAAESSLIPNREGGGLYQQSGDGKSGTGTVAEQSQQVLETLSPSLIAALNNAKSGSEAANLIMKDFERPAGSQPGETATTDQQTRREQVAEEAGKHLTSAIQNTVPTAATTGIKSAITNTKATSAATAVKTAIETAKLNLTEAKKVFSTAFGELAKLSEKLLTYTLAKGGVKNAELKALEEGHEKEQTAAAVANAETKVTEAKAGGNATEIKAAQDELNAALYAAKVAALKQEAQVEEAAIAKQNAAKESAFTAALNQLKTHLEKGKMTTKQGMAEIEKVLKQSGITFGSVGKDAGDQWVKQFEAAIKRAAQDAGGIMAALANELHVTGATAGIPKAAAGGIVTSPTLLIAGEAGPEAIIPLSGLSTAQPAALPGVAASASGGNTINLYSTVYTQATTLAGTVNAQYQALRPMLNGI